MTRQTAYETDLLAALHAGVHERLGAVTAAGRDLTQLGSAHEVARRMLAVVPNAHPWDEQIGPFYDTAGLTRWLGVTKQALADRVRRHRLLAVTTEDGRVLYPARQFDGRQLVAGLLQALAIFRESAADGWAIASWLTTPAAALGGASPLDRMHRGEDIAAVLELAEVTAARWAA